MSISELEKKFTTIHIGGREYRARYSLNSLLCLENCYKPLERIIETPATSWGIEDVLQLTRAALCDLPQNKAAVIARDWKNIQPSIAELGEQIDIKDLRVLRFELINAITNSLPQPVQGSEISSDTEIDYQVMRSIYCDIMRRSEKEFWTSTLNEIKQRTDTYLELKGLKERAEQLQMYDD